ncbi:MAG: hypothetical protein SCI25_15910 [Desulfuromonadales bacterium]|nr:hypothetical protein [Desulfuromonadales bacterium]MDW7758981.1 hypothetical protein [Desulfuromonadales bacterium]
MQAKTVFLKRIQFWLVSAGMALLVTGCGGSGSSDPVLAEQPAPASTVIGTLSTTDSAQVATLAVVSETQPTLTLDDSTTEIPLGPQGYFEVRGIADGDHSLYLHQMSGQVTEIPFRMLEGRGLNLGTVTIRDGALVEHTGFNGYHFGFIDENGDGINDNFMDADGDGICDRGGLYAGYTYMMEAGFVDEDGNGINDLFRDADGDGINDLNQMVYGHGFGFVDTNGDGVNDRFVDANGDGICDLTGMPFRHPFGYQDENGDGINDLFVDENGNGYNDLTTMPYMPIPGWVDLDGDGVNDYFRDANGDGIGDLSDLPMSYGHGFGWVDANGDGINDRFVDANGDGINDYAGGPYAQMPYRYGFGSRHQDDNGDGIDDQTGRPYCMGFGWVDANQDGINDAFIDTDADGVNDVTGYHYDRGYIMESGHQGYRDGAIDWPMHGGGMMM